MAEKPGRVLDLGCGNGILLQEISSRIGSGVGVDISERMLRLAREHTSGLSNISFLHRRHFPLPFPDRSFDCVPAVFSLRYFCLPAALPEIHRVLKNGGVFIAVDQFAYGLRRRSPVVVSDCHDHAAVGGFLPEAPAVLSPSAKNRFPARPYGISGTPRPGFLPCAVYGGLIALLAGRRMGW
jgi:ubiquinone/menaquinone biosynthesis C-methylase UbiE